MSKKIKSAEDLENLSKEIVKSRGVSQYVPTSITVSSGTCGEARGSLRVIQAFQEWIEKQGLKDKVALKVTGCHGFCEVEPIVIIRKG